ncbi:GIDE domain-containing protein [Haloarchaeobius litoreus]|uniref:RING-type E3 ubiquitin transferase n=1 Tax=Haloarchaeobius litoreus TaxID=755306 RepID=A0ABD6DDI3_9EURY|nr:GIDE domain-containing protein [Haloarchaeobius litoreus]
MASITTGLVFLVVALIPTYLFVQARGATQAVGSTERVSTATVTDGTVAVSGTVEAGPAGVLTHPVTGADALAVRWDVDERDVDEDAVAEVDDSGRQTVPFRLVDDDGAVDVDPTGADLHLSTTHGETFVDQMRTPGEQATTFIDCVQENERRSHDAGTTQVHNTPINEARVHGVDDLHYQSRALQPGDTGYVLGYAQQNDDGTDTIGDGGGEFIVSDMTRDELTADLGTNQWLLVGVALLFYAIAVYVGFLA